jgi:hypothetical protein
VRQLRPPDGRLGDREVIGTESTVAREIDPPSPASIAAAQAACKQELLQHVLQVGGASPRQGLEEILVRHPDALAVINEFIGLCELHTYRQMANVFVRRLEERGR